MWTFGSVRVYVTKLSGNNKQTIARLQPFGGGTIHQVFGYENETYKVSAYVVGDTNLDSLKVFATTGITYDLVNDSTTIGSFYVSSLSWDRVPAIYQTLTAVCEDPLYTIELELYK